VLGAVLVGVASAPSFLAGDVAGAVVTVFAGIATFFAGGYMGAIGMTAPLE
jgi:hypothetical protein